MTNMQQAWILQLNSAEFDLQTYLARVLAGEAERESEWQVQRYAQELKAGDLVFFWQSGPQGGLLAWGELLSAAYPAEESGWCVGFRLTHAVRPALQRADLLPHAALQQMLFLRRPQGQWFRVDPAARDLLLHLLQSRSQRLPAFAQGLSWARLYKRVQQQGLQISENMLRRYHLALQTSAFVMLAGVPGIGKSWLTRAYAHALGARYQLVPVAPNWVSPEDLLGYYNPVSERFQLTPTTRFLQEAQAAWQQAQRLQQPALAFHLVLDEINLARVEYYLAPLLSLLELRRQGETALLQLADGSSLALPPNLVVIGTLNRDEFAQPLSAKVYDRAMYLELELSSDLLQQLPAAWASALEPFWEPLQALCQLGFRALQDMHSYLDKALALGVPLSAALDEALVQKALARLHFLSPAQQLLAEDLLNALQASATPLPLSQQRLIQLLQAVSGY